MGFEETISEIIRGYGSSLWLGFVVLIVTGIATLSIKNLISDIVNYYITRMSDLGYGAMILWNGKLKRVVEIKFKYIKVVDDEEILFIPIETWLKSIKSFPQPRNDQFNEEKWKEKPWDGRTERRSDRRKTNTE
jgi:hypothetical protein